MKSDPTLFRQTLKLWVDHFPHSQLPTSHDRIENLWKLIDVEETKEENESALDNSDVFLRLDELVKKGTNLADQEKLTEEPDSE